MIRELPRDLMARESVAELLEIRFGKQPPQVMTWLNQLTDVPTLKGLLREAATAESIGAFEQFIKVKMQSGDEFQSRKLPE